MSGTVWTFVLGLGLWLLSAKIYRAPTTFFQMREVAGLASMISLLGLVISMFLVMATGSLFSNIGPILLIPEFNPASKTHLALASLNVITLWYLAVLSLGVAHVSRTSWMKMRWRGRWRISRRACAT